MTPPAAANGTPILTPEFVALLRHRELADATAAATAETPQPDPEPRQPGRRWPRPDGDTVIRLLTAAVVLAVASFAAVVSYSHIYALGHHHGQDGTAARLLPLSIDGLIAAASLVMLHASRNSLPVPRLARAMLATGVAATVAANVLYAIPAQWIGPAWSAVIGAAISAFPAVAFIGSVEMMIRFVRDARAATDTAASGDSASDTDSASDEDPSDSDGDKGGDNGERPKRQRGGNGGDKVRDILKRRPKLRADLLGDDARKRAVAKTATAEAAGVSERTVERVMRELEQERKREDPQ